MQAKVIPRASVSVILSCPLPHGISFCLQNVSFCHKTWNPFIIRILRPINKTFFRGHALVRVLHTCSSERNDWLSLAIIIYNLLNHHENRGYWCLLKSIEFTVGLLKEHRHLLKWNTPLIQVIDGCDKPKCFLLDHKLVHFLILSLRKHVTWLLLLLYYK